MFIEKSVAKIVIVSWKVDMNLFIDIAWKTVLNKDVLEARNASKSENSRLGFTESVHVQ